MSPRRATPAGVVQQEYALAKIDTLTEHPDNPRRSDDEVIGESIEANGFFGACIVQASTRYVLAGNGRLRASRAQGLSEVPVIYVDVDDATAKRILLADNRASDLGAYDNDALLAILSEAGDLTGTLYRDDDLAALRALVDDPPHPPGGAGGASPEDGDGPDGYQEQWAVLVVCSSEGHQQDVYDALKDLYTCRVVTT